MKKIALASFITVLFNLEAHSQIPYVEDSIVVESINSSPGWRSIFFTSDSIGYLRDFINVYKTIDGGKKWDRILNQDIYSANYLSDSLIFILTHDSGIKRSTDGGNSWVTLSKPDITRVRGLLNFKSDSFGLIKISDYTYNPVSVWKTTDAGQVWTNVFNVNNGYIQKYDFVNENEGYVIVNDSLMVTNDGGVSWYFDTKMDPGFFEQFNYPNWFDNGDTLVFTSMDKGPIYIPKPATLLKNENSYFENGGSLMALSRNSAGNIAMLVREPKTNKEGAFIYLYFYSSSSGKWSKIKRLFPETLSYFMNFSDNNKVHLSNGSNNLIRSFEFGNFSFVPDICFIEPNSKDQLTINWSNDGVDDIIVRHNIYKKVGIDQYDLIGASIGSSFTDTLSNSKVSSEKYTVSAIFTDSIESYHSKEHGTILLQAGMGLKNEVLLTWNPYIGLDYDQVQIWSGSNESNLDLLATLPADNFRYTDLNPQGKKLYQVRFEFESACTNSTNGRISDLSVMKSNYVDLLGLQDQSKISLYPNPSGTYLNLDGAEGKRYHIFNTEGQKVADGIVTNEQINIKNLISSHYLIGIDGTYLRFIKN